MLGAAPASAQLTVSPTYLLFDDAVSTKAITVQNADRKEQVFRVSLIDLRMLPDGKMVRAEPPAANEHFASGMVRFAPREIVLAPGASEVVRLQVPPPGRRPAGEYRTHVLVQQVPYAQALGASPFAPEAGVSLDLQAVFGVAVPLIMRERGMPGAVAIAGIKLVPTPDDHPAVALALERSGERSVRGELALLLDGETIETVDGVALYAPAHRRDMVLALPSSVPPIAGHRLEARFHETETAEGENTLEAKMELAQ
ncbi:MAG TPA: hypothetical protein VEI03_19645 [Stellaceae bacterium]|nr:hypothetical protein [Stellaceae bacterium]